MEANIKFNLPEEKPELDMMMKAGAAFAALHEIQQEIFRPYRKHGYKDKIINDLLAECNRGDLSNPNYMPTGDMLLEVLEKKFHEILAERELEV